MTETTAAAGVQFPTTGRSRSTSAFGRAVVGEALRATDPVGSRAAEHETNWRSGYLPHLRRLVEAGLGSPEAARTIAAAGAAATVGSMRWVDPDGELALTAVGDVSGSVAHEAVTVTGRGEPVTELGIPERGRLLTGSALERRVEEWVAAGVVEPSVADAVRTVAANPEWLSLPGHTMVALGAGAEIGPTPVLLDWGSRVVGIDLPSPAIWGRVIDHAAASAGTLVVPASAGHAALAERAGLDLLTELPDAAAWVAQTLGEVATQDRGPGQDGRVVLGNYMYADGGLNVRVSAAGDMLGTLLRERLDDLTLAWLATPTDVFAVPREAVDQSVAAYESRGVLAKGPGRGLRALTGGRLLQRAYRPGADPGICDSLVPQQGPNYALGKRLQRWRATTERTAGRRVSLNVAPPTQTRSVVKNRALAAAYAGSHRFGVRVFAPDTCRTLMAALLVHDLYGDRPGYEHPWQEEAHQAAHGGLWRTAYSPRSALGLAALLGYGATRG